MSNFTLIDWLQVAALMKTLARLELIGQEELIGTFGNDSWLWAMMEHR